FVQVLFGNVVGPKLMGKSLDLSPTVILFFLLLWAWIWGAAGALLSVPIAVIVKIVCDNVTYLQPIGVLLSAGK
ncbi:MAG: AI-2E family transporter, partial [Pyramidobacter sp.]|nr:AI-2E family transporter [Pyramidobacter sp.]